MANYSTQMRSYVEMMIRDSVPDISRVPHKKRIEMARDKIFDFDFPIFDEDYRAVLETKILRYFYFAELGSETVGHFQFDLETWLQLNMPYYNQFYKTELYDFDPMINVDYRDKYTRSNDSNRNTTGQTTEKGDKAINQNQTNKSDENSSQNSNSNVVDSLSENTNATDRTIDNAKKDSDTKLTENSTHTDSNNGNSTSVTDTTEKVNETTENEHLGAKKVNSQSMPQNRVNAETGYTTQVDVTNENSKDNGTKETDTTGHSDTNTTTDNKEDYSGEHDADTKYTENTHDDSLSKSASNHVSTDNTHADTNMTGNSNVSGSNTNNILQDTTNQGTSHENQKFDNTEQYVFHRIGKLGGNDYAQMVSEMRDNIINIDMMLLKQLDHDLFMGVIL